MYMAAHIHTDMHMWKTQVDKVSLREPLPVLFIF